MDEPLSPDAPHKAEEVRRHFLVPFDLEPNIRPIREDLLKIPISFRAPADTFCEHLKATGMTTAVPYRLANIAAYDERLVRSYIGGRIRAIVNGEAIPEETESERVARERETAIASAAAFVKQFNPTKEAIADLESETELRLLSPHHGSEIQSISRELLLQGAVSLWSALEMFVRDEIILLLNQRPELAGQLLSDASAKTKFDVPKLSIENLMIRGFDLSKQMGQILFEERDLSNLVTLKAACNAIFDSAQLREKLGSPILWRLNQDRHLIVHRRGIVDDEYRKKASSTLKSGDQLSIKPDEFIGYARVVSQVGAAFLKSLSETIAGASS